MAEIRLHLREADGDLPDVCMVCGEPSSVTKTKNMQWFPPWINILILAGLLPYAIIAMILTKRARVQGPFCDDHKGHWLNRTLMIWGSLLLVGFIAVGIFILLAIMPVNNENAIGGFLCLLGVAVLVAWVIFIIILQNTAIRPREITDKEIVLKGVSEAFVDAVTEADLERRARNKKRRSKWEDEEEDEEPRPRKRTRAIEEDEDEPRPLKRKRPPSDAIEE